MKKFKSNEAGTCPACGNEDLDYDTPQIGDGLSYPWKCKKCKADGEEWYSIEFVEHCNVTDKNGKEITADGKPQD